MLKHARQGNTLTVKLDGELDQDSSVRIRRELDDLIADTRIKHLVLDMQGLTFMDSSGIGVVIGRYRTLATRGGGVAVRGESTHVQRIMKLSGLYSILEEAR
ncbi:anti-sigma F factor antagonist [Clostridia bacterium]|nr:anti-sigma F factor antagonist [Clostridia bacterium]